MFIIKPCRVGSMVIVALDCFQISSYLTSTHLSFTQLLHSRTYITLKNTLHFTAASENS